MTRPAAEVRAEMSRWKQRQIEARSARQHIEAAFAAELFGLTVGERARAT